LPEQLSNASTAARRIAKSKAVARVTGLEPATSGVTGHQDSKQHQSLFRISIARMIQKNKPKLERHDHVDHSFRHA
jgi:hypothetical protein